MRAMHVKLVALALFTLLAPVPCWAGGWYVGNTNSNEWIKYNQVYLTNGTYRFVARVASPVNGATVHMEVDGIAVQSNVSVPNTGRADSFTNIYLGSKAVSQGNHDLKVVFETGNVSLDWFMLSKDSDTFNGVKASDITMVRPSTSGMLIAPVFGFEHKTVNPGVGSSLCSVPGNDINGHPYTDAQLSAWYAVPMYRDYDRRTDRYWDIAVDDLLASRAQVPLFHCRATTDFTHNLQDRDYQEGAGAYEGRWLGKLAAAIGRNPQAASALKIGMFWESGGLADGFKTTYGYYPSWGDPNLVTYAMQYWLGPWFDNVPSSMLYQPVASRPIISFFSNRPTDTVSDGRMGDFIAGIRAKLEEKYGYNPFFILPVGGDVDSTALTQAWGQAPWLSWDGPLLTTNSFATFPWDTTSCGSRRRIDTVWLNDWNPATNTGSPNAGDANGHDSFQSHLDSNGNSELLTTLSQALAAGAKLVQEEGFTNISEGNGIFHSYNPAWQYPNQHLAAMRQYADPATQTLMFEAEGCDAYSKTTSAINTGGSYRWEWYGGSNTLDVYRPLHNLQGWGSKSAGPGNLVQISAGFFDVWALASNGTVWAEHIAGAPDSWQLVSAPTLTSISVGKGYVWGLNGTTVYSTSIPYGWSFNANNGWTQRSGSMTQISVGETAVWGVNASGQVYTRPLDGSGSWTQVAGTMDKVFAGDNFIWGIRGSTISYSPTSSISWTAVNNPNNITQLEVGSEEVWGVNAGGQIYRRSVSGIGDWDAVSNPGVNLTSITVGENYVWGLAGNTPYTQKLEGFAGSVAGTPMGLTARVAPGQTTLSWTSSTAATGYNIKRSTTSGGPYTTIDGTSAATTSYTDTGLSNGTTYYYVVSAVSSAGETANSAEVSATQQSATPAAPSNLTASAGSGGQINLTWTDNATNENGFQIERQTGVGGTFVEIAAVPGGVTTFSDTTTSGGPDYYYRVRAYNMAGTSGYTNMVLYSTSANLLNRTGWVMSASVSSGGSPSNTIDGDLTTRWGTGTSQVPGQWFQVDMGSSQTVYQINLAAPNSNGDYPAGYQVNVSNDGTNWGSPVATGTGTQGVAVMSIPFSAQTARYIRVTQTGNRGGWWSIDEFNVYGVPSGVPSMVQLSRTGWVASASSTENGGSPSKVLDGSLTTRWSTGASQTNGQWFQIDMGSNQIFSQIVLAAPNSINDYPAGYQVNVSTNGTSWGSPVASGTSTQGVASMTITFSAQTARYIRITQTTTGVTGNWWSIDEFNVYAAAIPATPNGLTSGPGASAGQVALSWIGSTGVQSYTIQRSTTSGSGYAIIATVNAPATSYTDSDPALVAGQTYYYEVVATNSNGSSLYSAPVWAAPYAASSNAASPYANTFCNPVNVNYNLWTDNPGVGPCRREGSDPTMVVFNNEYYLFASHSGGYWWSTDMLNWNFVTPVGTALNIDAFAPTVTVWNNVMYYTAWGSNMCSSTNPKSGVWTSIRNEPGQVDPTLFRDDDGKWYCYSATGQNLLVQQLNPNNNFATLSETDSLLGPNTGWSNMQTRGYEVGGDNNEQTSTTQTAIEATGMTKYNGKYYLQYSTPGTQYRTYCDAVYVGANPTGPFTLCPYAPFCFKPGGFVTGVGSSTTFTDLFGKYWHVTTVSVKDFDRRVAIFPAGFDSAGQYSVNTYMGDYPQYIPGKAPAGATNNLVSGANVLSYGKAVSASSTLSGFPASNAVDENIRTWWSATTANPGEWLLVDLGSACSVGAIQTNFAEQNLTYTGGRGPAWTIQYKIEGSLDGNTWTTLIDKSANTTDVPHDYVPLPSMVTTRYIRITNEGPMPGGGLFAIRDLRVFGSAPGNPPPQVSSFSVNLNPADSRTAVAVWNAVSGADGYIIRYGIDPNKLNNNYQILGGNVTSYSIKSLIVGVNYYFTIDAYNGSGVTSGTSVQQAGNVVALNRTGWVMSASVSSSGNPPSNTIDGNLTTRWGTGTAQVPGQWFQVDMGSSQTFSQIVLAAPNSNGDYPAGYQVNVSNDGTNWGSPVATGTSTQGVTSMAIAFPTQTARYIRITQTGSTTGNWWSIDEFNVYGPMLQLSRTGWIASASSTENGGLPANVLDGSLTTRWSTGANQTNGQWFQIDMGSNQSVSQIVLAAPNSNNDYPVGYQVNVSTDGISWGNPVAAGTGIQGVPSMAISFSAQTARYIRITQTGSTTGNWWSIDDFNVYGTVIPATPIGLIAGPGASAGQIALSWTASSGATSYTLLRSTISGSGYSSLATINAPTVSYTDSDPALVAGQTYYYEVDATNSNGSSAYSAPVSSTPYVPPNIVGWRYTYFGQAGLNPTMANGAADMANPAQDGLVNLLKYALGINPQVSYANYGSTAMPVIQTQSFSGVPYLTLTFTGTATDVTYTVQATNSLTSTWSTIYTSSGSTAPGTVTVQDSQPISSSPKRFMRLQVSRP